MSKSKSTTEISPYLKLFKSEILKTSPTDHETAMLQYKLELNWCIKQLEISLKQRKKERVKEHLEEKQRALEVLKNEEKPILSKRLLMRMHCGDYNSKMLAEGVKLCKPKTEPVQADKEIQLNVLVKEKSASQTLGDNLRTRPGSNLILLKRHNAT